MRAWSSARWSIPLPEGHRFPMGKYRLVRDGIVAQGVLPAESIHEPDGIARDDLGLVHGARYIDAVCDGTLTDAELRRIGFPWSPLMPERSRRTVQGTLEACRDACAGGAGINLAGGTHHAFPDHGEGYCVFNDVAVAIRALQREGVISRAAIVDLDVHQGNGTARIFASDPDVFTFSMHGARNYPFRKEQSRLDVELPDGADDALYLERLEAHLGPVLEDARPELVVYIGGADPYRGDRLGRLGLSIEGLRQRDRVVFDATWRRGTPVAMVLGGGYAADLADLVTIHANTVRELLTRYEASNGDGT
jgi:acetoin utilization deacetylase AcuC-like enzyme